MNRTASNCHARTNSNHHNLRSTDFNTQPTHSLLGSQVTELVLRSTFSIGTSQWHWRSFATEVTGTVRDIVLLTSVRRLFWFVWQTFFHFGCTRRDVCRARISTIVSEVASLSLLGYGARSDVETELSLPFSWRSIAWCWFASTKSTISHRGSLLFRTNLRSSTVPGENSHEGRAIPNIAVRGKRTKCLWGVSLVERQTNNRTACKVSGKTLSHCPSCRFLPCKISLIFLQMVWFIRSHWPLPCGW